MAKEISLRPYPGVLWVAKNAKEYKKAQRKVFKVVDPHDEGEVIGGKFFAGENKEGSWAYMIWADSRHYLVHEISHVLMHLFDRCGIDPRDSGGEAFCYMIQTLFEEATDGSSD